MAALVVLYGIYAFLTRFGREILVLSESGMIQHYGPWGLPWKSRYDMERIESVRAADNKHGLEMDYRGKRKVVFLGSALDSGQSQRLLKIIGDYSPGLLKAKPRFSAKTFEGGAQFVIHGREWFYTRTGLEKWEEDEKLTVSKELWTLGPAGSFKAPQRFDPSKIIGLRQAPHGKSESFARKFMGTYGLEFDYEGKIIKFAKGLSPEEAKPLLEEIKKYHPGE